MSKSPSFRCPLETGSHMATILQAFPHMNPGHFSEDHALNLCVRKGRLSPNCPQDYDSAYTPKSVNSEDSRSPRQYPCVPSVDINRIPFKIYPMNPFMDFPEISCKDFLENSTKAYAEFRAKMLSQKQDNYNMTNSNMKRNQNYNPRNADPEYLEKRRKNNQAAKRSRDARRAREEELTIKAKYLEWENFQFRANFLRQWETEHFRANDNRSSD